MGIFKPDKPEMPKQSEQEKALAEVGAKQWNNYVDMYVPQEARHLEELRSTEAEEARTAGRSSADIEVAKAGAKRARRGASFSAGMKNSDGATKMSTALGNDTAAGSKGDVMASIDVAGDTEELRGLASVVALGRNKTNNAVSGMADIAQRKTGLAIAKMNADLEKSISKSQLAGEVLGATLGAASQAMGGSGGNQFQGVDRGTNPMTGESYRAYDGKKYWGMV